MNETTYIYIVHSDINENNIYAEFETEEEAIEYARRNKDELTYVDRVEVELDEDGDIIEEIDSETIWVYDEEDDEADLGDTTWFEDLDTEALVEKMEESETVVECKECFELFPKEECTKIEIGYICPNCGKIHSHEEPEFEIDSIPDVVVADDDFFKVDFPELERTEFGNDMIPDEPTPEVENDPISEPECVGPECEAPVEAPITKEETIDTLVKDEEEAIEGYDKAKVEIEANPEMTEEEKEEALEVIEHIKEEEVEHIEELEELVDEAEETKETEVAVEEPKELVEELADWRLDNVGFSYDSLETVEGMVTGDCTVYGYMENAEGGEEETYDDATFKYNPKTKESTVKGLSADFTKEDIKEIEKVLSDNLDTAIDSEGNIIMDSTESTPLSEAWELDSARITDEVKTTGRLVKGTFVVIGFKDVKEQTNFRGEYEYNLDTKKLKLKGVAFKFSPKHIKEIEAQLKADIDEHLDDNGKYTVNVSQAVDLNPVEPEVGESNETNHPRALDEHVNEEHPAIESDQELEGTDNAVVDCEVADIITHSEDEKPLDCEMKKAPLEKPLTEEVAAVLTKKEFAQMEAYLKSGKYRSLDTEWTDEGGADRHFAIDEVGAYLDYNPRINMFTLGLSIYHASEDNNAEYPERHTDEDEFSYDSLAEMYEDEDCTEILNRLYKDNLAKMTKALSEETHAQFAKPEGNRVQAFNNALKYAKQENKPFIYGYTNHTGKFFAAETPMKVSNPLEAEKEFRQQYKNCKVLYMAYPDKDFIKESLYNFTKVEQEDYHIDEDGNSLDSHDTYVRCNWCKEPFPQSDCKFELNMGWLCARCQEELRSHGGPLTLVEEPTEEQILKTLD